MRIAQTKSSRTFSHISELQAKEKTKHFTAVSIDKSEKELLQEYSQVYIVVIGFRESLKVHYSNKYVKGLLHKC